MSRIILQPCGNKDAQHHFEATIRKSLALKDVKPFVSANEFEVLANKYPNEECKIWGVTTGGNNLTKWNKISPGDITLFAKNKVVFASAVTTFKIQNQPLAYHLWGNNMKEETWENIYFLDEVKYHNISYLKFNQTVGYAENNIIQGFNVLDPQKSQKLIRAFDLESDTYFEEVSEARIDQVLTKLDELEETESTIQATRRLEQAYLKRLLFGNKTIDKCACCKKDFPISFLVTAHIKKRSRCSKEERMDPNIVMPMCKLGCDELYERGYISVKEGLFIDMKKTLNSPTLQSYIDKVASTACSFFNSFTREYFAWHFQNNCNVTS